MKLRVISILVFLYFFGGHIYAQSNLNAYKYVTVPEQYDFLKQADKYKLNSLTKFLFNKEGFKTLFSSEIKPEELAKNNCLNLLVSVIDVSNILTTKLTVELTNCRNEVVYTGEGRSKIKEYKKAYHEALRRALEPLNNANYAFNAELITLPVTQVAVLKESPILEEKVLVKTVNNQPTDVKEVLKIDKVEDAVEVAVEDVVEEAEAEAVVKVESVDETIKPSVNEDNIDINEVSNYGILYAQKRIDGYQLVDSSPKVVFILLQSSVIDLFMLKDKNGIVFKKNDKWILEYYAEGTLIQKELNIKF